jgi:uncharacterized protein (DUF1330 family)
MGYVPGANGRSIDMAYERLVALNVTDESRYAQYRAGMTPLLHAMGGRFRFDCRPGEILGGELSHPVTRVFVISFPDRATHDRFFADEAYRAVREAHFAGSVQGHTLIAAYEC